MLIEYALKKQSKKYYRLLGSLCDMGATALICSKTSRIEYEDVRTLLLNVVFYFSAYDETVTIKTG